MRFFVKILVSVSIIAFCGWIADKYRLSTLAWLIAVMPLTGSIVLVWVYLDNPSNFRMMTNYCRGALWGILPSILFFVVASICFRRQLPLWIVLSAGFTAWLAGALIHQWLLK